MAKPVAAVESDPNPPQAKLTYLESFQFRLPTGRVKSRQTAWIILSVSNISIVSTRERRCPDDRSHCVSGLLNHKLEER